MELDAIYTNCEEPDPAGLRDYMSDRTSKRAGGFLSQCCRCCSEGTSISVLYIANVVLFLLWIITISIISVKYLQIAKEMEQLHKNQTQLRANDSKMAKEVEQLHENQAQLRANVTKELHDLQTEKGIVWNEMYKVENVLQSLNACKICPEGWLLNRGKCYYFHEESLEWSSARKFCEDQGGHLVVINDADEQTFLQTKENPSTYWIGLHDTKSENDFVWVDGSHLSYTHWLAGEPNNANSHENCVQMRDNGGWNDFPCTQTVKGSICEKTWNC